MGVVGGGRCLLLALASLAIVLGCAASDAPAAVSGSVTGKLKGTHIPAAARGAADVRAIRLDTGVIAAARRVGSTGYYAMKLPAGAYVVVGMVVDRKAGKRLTGSGPSLSLGPGARRLAHVVVRPPAPRRSPSPRRPRSRRLAAAPRTFRSAAR